MKLENRAIQTVLKWRLPLFCLIVTCIAALVRYIPRRFHSYDMYCLLDWYDQIAGRGLASLGTQVGDYNIPYQTIIALMSYIPMQPILLYKMISIFFDFVLALVCGCFVCDLKGEKYISPLFAAVWSVVLMAPNVFLNSAYWGQCDSIYTSFTVLCLYMMYREKYLLSFLALGISFAFKLQTVFILPFLVTLYFVRQRFSAVYVLAAVAAFWLSGLPGYLSGRSLLAPFTIYLYQMGEYPQMYLNIHSFWQLVGDNYELLHLTAISMTMVLLGGGLMLCLSGRKKLDTPERFLNTAVWFVWTCVLFLPGMHERYTYGADLLLILLTFLKLRYLKYALVCNFLSLLTYKGYLFSGYAPGMPGSLVYTAAWIFYSWELLAESGDSTQALPFC